MEYYGKILCISYHDLTYDDRPVIIDGKGDYSRSRALKDVHPSISFPRKNLHPSCQRLIISSWQPGDKSMWYVQEGGLGGYALVEVATLPIRFQERIKLKYGDMKDDILRNWFGSHFHINPKAREFYSRFRFDNGNTLPPERIQEYTVNASVIESVLELMADTVLMRRAMKGGPVNWERDGGGDQLLSNRIRAYVADKRQPLQEARVGFQGSGI